MITESQEDSDNVVLWEPKSKSVLHTFFIYFIPLFLIMTVLLMGIIIGDYFRTSKLVNANEKLQVNIIKKTLTRDLAEIGPDLSILIHSDNFQKYLTTPGPDTKKDLEVTFSLFAKHRRVYSQIRFLDLNGHERARVDFDNTRVTLVPENQLQNKSSRYYFQQAINIDKGDIFVSPLDLNIDHGKISIPYKPVIRFATPVVDTEGNKKGVLVLNYLANRMLEHFDELLEGTWGHIDFINQDGYWIRSHIKSRNWGFMFKNKARFQQRHGDVWPTISSRDSGYVKGESGHFNFVTINPLQTMRKSIQFIPEFGDVVHQSDDRVWKIVSDVSEKIIIDRVIDNLVHVSGPAWVLLITLLIFGNWRFAKFHVKNQQFQLESELHARVFAWTTEGVTITDASGNIVDVNNGFTRITGYSRDEVIGKNPRVLASGKHDEHFYHNMWSEIKSKGFWEGEIFNRRKDGAFYCEWIHIASVYDRNKRLLNYVAVFSDITKKKTDEEALIRQAYEDPLTGLGNRLSLDGFLDQELARSHRYKTKLAFLYIDLNDFKPINDTHGHAAGDVVLREVAQRLQTHARDTDKVIRLGGDEFGFVLTDIQTKSQADEIAQRIIDTVKEKINTSWGSFEIGASLGVAIYPDNAKDKKALIDHADKAMYEQKKKKKKKKKLKKNN